MLEQACSIKSCSLYIAVYESCAHLRKIRNGNICACNNDHEYTRLDYELWARVRKIHNDVTFIDEFLTPEFVQRQHMFTYAYNKPQQEYVIDRREFDVIKEKLLSSLSNFGQPRIQVEDGNFQNRGELYLTHPFDGTPLRLDHARATLENVARIWQRPVHLETVVEKRRKVLTYNGSRHDEKSLR